METHTLIDKKTIVIIHEHLKMSKRNCSGALADTFVFTFTTNTMIELCYL